MKGKVWVMIRVKVGVWGSSLGLGSELRLGVRVKDRFRLD